MSELYDNLLKATDNTSDITTEKYGVITKLDGLYCSVKETDNDLEHTNVPIVNGANLSVGDKVIIGFINNSIYDAVCYGALDKQINDDSKQDLLIVDDSLSTTSTNPVQNKVLTGALNGKANSSHAHLSSDVTDLIDVIYPVGSIYMSVNSTNPSVLFGGTWEQIKDTFLLATGDTYANGSTGGEATHTLTTDEIPSHLHREANSTVVYNNSSSNRFATSGSGTRISLATNLNINTNSTGGGQAHNNMPPYLVVNVWKRTA